MTRNEKEPTDNILNYATRYTTRKKKNPDKIRVFPVEQTGVEPE